jgi:hypothetical protein
VLADLPNSSFRFSDPKQGSVFGALINGFLCVMHAFRIEFALTFDPSPTRGVGGSPMKRELWQIGIVQNVVFDKINFEYDGGIKFQETFRNSVLDSWATIHSPFYGDPVLVETCQLDPHLPCKQFIRLMTPVIDVWYTSKGYGEFLSPYDPTEVLVNNQPNSVDMWDEPTFGARKQLSNGAWISVAERIRAFQIWLVAQTSTRVHVLASLGPFSLVFWMTARAPADLLSIGTPPNSFGYYGEAGITQSVNRSGKTPPPTLRMQAGTGGRNPVLTGQTANDRGRHWLINKGLIPPNRV